MKEEFQPRVLRMAEHVTPNTRQLIRHIYPQPGGEHSTHDTESLSTALRNRVVKQELQGAGFVMSRGQGAP